MRPWSKRGKRLSNALRRKPVDPGQIIADRKQLMAEIRRLRSVHGDASGLPAKAETLLTNMWRKATWDARAQLIHSARWLMRLEGAAASIVEPPHGKPSIVSSARGSPEPKAMAPVASCQFR